jgi:hypothetical protein
MSVKEALDKKDITKLINSLNEILNLIKSKNNSEREIGWKAINFLIETGNLNILEPYKNYLRSLLWHKLQGIRDDAWKNLNVYKLLAIEGIERILTANSDKIKWSGWSNVLKLINMEIVPKTYVISVRYSYWRLLKSNYATIRKKAWRLFKILVKEEIFTKEDKNRFVDFLKHKKANIRILAWKTSLELVKIGFITIDELKEYKQYLEELTTRQSKVKKVAEKLIKELA